MSSPADKTSKGVYPPAFNPNYHPQPSAPPSSVVAIGAVTAIDLEAGQALGFSEDGLRNIADKRNEFTHEIVIIDNSKSTLSTKHHGYTILKSDDGKFSETLYRDTIFTQIMQTVQRRAKLLRILGAEKEPVFRFLNHVKKSDLVKSRLNHLLDVAVPREKLRYDSGQIEQLLGNITPKGTTPLLPRIEEVVQELKANTDGDVNAHVTFVTDGIPTDEEGKKMSLDEVANKLLDLFPTSDEDISTTVVIQIATDDEKVVSFYNDLDRKIGENLQIDVMVDLNSEQQEINRAGNSWYRHTEAGELFRVYYSDNESFDNLDEEKLGIEVARTIMQIVYGKSPIFERFTFASLGAEELKQACLDIIEKAPKSLGVQDDKRVGLLPIIDPQKFNF